MSLLDGAVVVVTGAASGNGRGIALAAARHGARAVVVADVSRDPREGGEPTDLLLEQMGVDCRFVETDVSDLARLQACVDAAEEFGGVTVMVNNAGVLSTTPFLDAGEAEFERVMGINVKSVFFGSQFAAASMVRDGRRGSIVNLSSTSAIRGTGELPIYTATKGAVQSLSYALAGSLGQHGIRVNALCPGIIRTSMTETDMDMTTAGVQSLIPLGRFGQPSDVGDAVAYLASELSAYVTGTSLVLDGGMTYAEALS